MRPYILRNKILRPRFSALKKAQDKKTPKKIAPAKVAPKVIFACQSCALIDFRLKMLRLEKFSYENDAP